MNDGKRRRRPTERGGDAKPRRGTSKRAKSRRSDGRRDARSEAGPAPRRRADRDDDLRALEEAVTRLDRVAGRILSRALLGQAPVKPIGHVPVEVEVALERSDPRARARALLESLRARVESVGDGAVALRPGRIYCFRSRTSSAPHCVPSNAREVFIGYDPTGRPRFNDFADLALARGDERIEHLYADPPRPIAIYDRGSDLRADQLGVFGRGSAVFRILGQVAIGYLPFDARGVDERAVISLTLQAVETRRKDGRAQLDLNVVATAPAGPLEPWLVEAFDGALLRSIRTTRRDLRELGRRARERRAGATEQDVEAPLRALARSIERFCRQGKRRTEHSRDRRKQRDRPTQKALADAAHAERNGLYWDEPNGTFIVVAARGRTHAFAPDGRHVTSVNYSRDAIARKVRFKLWRELTADEVDAFRRSIDD